VTPQATDPQEAISAMDDLDRYLEETGLAAEGVGRDRIRDLGDGTWLMVKPLLFHWTMLRGDLSDTVGYFDRWCYADEAKARAAFAAFPDRPDADYEPAGWHRHPPSARRRPEGDAAREYLDA
jgi:hypothetical protein